MESKAYDLLEKLYAEMQEVKSEMHGMKSEMQEMKENMATKDEVKEIRETMATKEDLDLVASQLHAEIQVVHEELKELRHDFNVVEIMTTKSAFDIAKIKAAK